MTKVKKSKAKKSVKKILPSDITFIVDRSGSMGSCVKDVIGGFNTFMSEQKKVKGKAYFSMIQFDNEYLVSYEGLDVKDVKDLDTTSYVPRGSTALYDAIGKTITSINLRRLSTKDKRKYLVVIITDGEENSSREFNSEAIKALIEANKDQISFVYLAANADAILAAGSLGICKGNAANFKTSGLIGTMNTMSAQTTSYRGGAGGQSASNFYGGKSNV